MSVCWNAGRVLMGLVLAATTASVGNGAERFTFHHENVLGSSLEIHVDARDAAAADRAEQRILDEIDRQNRILSSYDAKSELSLWLKTLNQPVCVSPELFNVLAASERWMDRSHGAFSPGVELISQLWQRSETTGVVPPPAALQQAVRTLKRPLWKLDAEAQTATRLVDCPLSFNALAKGAILDDACRAAMAGHPEVTGASVMIGGDMAMAGTIHQEVSIVDPRHHAENDRPIAKIYLQQSALASSGGYRRGFQVADQWYSHLVDPRTGMPAGQIAAASVVAADAATADALATIFSIQSPDETARLAAELGDVAYLLILKNGDRVQNLAWEQLQEPGLFRFSSAARRSDRGELVAYAAEDKDEAKANELVVEFELNSPDGGRYRRPYVAIWLEDKDEFPVRTGLLWMQTKSPGPRWHRDLLRWYRNDSVRKLADGKDLIGTIAGATRGPGQYKAVFDGKDDAGNVLPAGEYVLLIEVAREHGTYQLIRQKVTLGTSSIPKTKLKSNVEIKSASYQYGPAAPASTTAN